MNVAIVKYNAGNVQSLSYALQHLGIQPIITDDVEILQNADKIIFPGQGEASTAMNYLQAKKMDVLLKNLKQPFLGICLGLQLMCKHSEENNTKGLGIFDVEVKKFDHGLKVPHMGWNTFDLLSHSIFEGITNPYLYYVHSYYAQICNETMATCNYGVNFSAVLIKNNYFAIQAHPEKSSKTGMKILENFIKMS